jgi:hypothetical protein
MFRKEIFFVVIFFVSLSPKLFAQVVENETVLFLTDRFDKKFSFFIDSLQHKLMIGIQPVTYYQNQETHSSANFGHSYAYLLSYKRGLKEMYYKVRFDSEDNRINIIGEIRGRLILGDFFIPLHLHIMGGNKHMVDRDSGLFEYYYTLGVYYAYFRKIEIYNNWVNKINIEITPSISPAEIFNGEMGYGAGLNVAFYFIHNDLFFTMIDLSTTHVKSYSSRKYNYMFIPALYIGIQF